MVPYRQVDWTRPPSTKPAIAPQCHRCGANTHMTLSYLYKVQICHHCGKEGNIQRICPSEQQVKLQQATKTPDVRPVEVEVDAYEDILGTLEVRNVRKQSNDIVWVDLDVDGKPLKMELDTCMAVSIISFDLYQQKFNRLTLHNTGPSLKTYSGENIMPVGVLNVPVDCQTQRELLDLYVVKNNGPALLGRDWLYQVAAGFTSYFKS